MKMKLSKFKGSIILSVLCALIFSIAVLLEGMASAENVDPDNDGSQYPYGENIGWLNAEPSGNGGPGVLVSDSLLTGYIWAENIGWVSLSCLNTGICSSLSYGVLNDGAGNLSGYAWGENVGWINFAPTGGGVYIDGDGFLRGRAWGENIGWITFRSDGAVPFGVKTSWCSAVDSYPPATSASGFASGWLSANVSGVLSAADNACGSGIKEVHYTLDVNPEVITSGSTATVNVTSEGIHSVSYFSVDNANNAEAAKALTVQIDKTAPNVNLVSPSNGGSYYINNAVTADYSATDTLSGIFSITGTVSDGGAIDTAIAGTKSFGVTAVDQAGNSASVTHTYTVIYPGNIDPENSGDQYAWGENVGWVNMKPSRGPGVTVTDTAVTGYVWNENVGWINLSPASYGGVFNNGAGVLSGYAWGENVGWINFAPTGGGVTVDPATGKFIGKVWGENIGWIIFSSSGQVSFSVTTAWRPPSDTTPPVLNMPADITAEATSPAGAVVNYPLPTATDNADPAPLVSCNLVSGSTFPLGAAIVTCTATDASGNNSSDNFTVTVVDTTSPSITCPANIVTEATSASGAMVSYPGATASDAVTVSPVIVYSVATGSTFTLGTTTVTATATDGAGNSAVCSFTVTVQDTTPPVVTPPSNITVPATEAGGARGNAWPALAAFIAGGSAVDAVDPAPSRLTPQVAGVDADNSTLFPVGATTVTFRFKDAGGNTGTATADVTVIIGQPRLSGKIAAKGRESGALYVDINLTNSGTGNARNIMLNQVLLRTLSGTGTVIYISPALPYPAGNLDVGATTVIRLYFNVPSTVTKFSITENGTVRNVVGTSYNYSIGQAVIP